MENSKEPLEDGSFSSYSGVLALTVLKELKNDLRAMLLKPFKKIQQFIGDNYLLEVVQEYCSNGFTHISDAIHRE